ncbi:uncharacterized protein TM35_000351410 [Trypanosoma theileri]|uniref:Ribosomal protein L30 ferredoxin-like fold domain-containing protein n=1 Tax=Trypanosoma theileri TaxID=67003 RepID=A0A1X0NL77_9TRYP|nr:uncharacterized protein TM35_000351410 [Trypanosoma theileri]ORC85397.1 hypothetical protein TM35_000351410 [Trypanosoma theileri]
MRRVWMPVHLMHRRHVFHATAIMLSTPSTSTTTTSTNTMKSSSNSAGPGTCIAPGPYRCVGNVFIVHCDDHPFKHSWEINRMLRELRLEFKGQTAIVPDIPQVRRQLWRVRHVVRVDTLDLDEARALIGVPEHVGFADLAAQLPAAFGRGRAVANPVMRSKMNFMQLRRMRLRDVLHRDALELRLLEERRKALATQQGTAEQQKGEEGGEGVK